jgi:HD-GYP domain-containing protein (c-di-GMP phosphodiesterase class II)
MSGSQPTPRTPQRLLPLWEGRSALIATGSLLTICCSLLLIFQPLFLRQAELRLYDVMLSNYSSRSESDVPVMVGIDEESLKVYGQWPWPRYRISRLVERLFELGADVLALDFLMPEPDRTSPDVVMAERRRDLASPYSFSTSSGQQDLNSQRLAAAIAKGQTIIGYYFDFSGRVKSEAGSDPAVPAGMIVTSETGSGADFPKPEGIIRSIQVLTAAAGAEGFTNANHDIDGVLRRTPVLLQHNRKYYPSLALGAVLLSSRDRNIRLTHNFSETMLLWEGHRIPLDHQGNLILTFRGDENPFRYISAKDILNNDHETESLRGKIVIVGAYANGLGDLHLVPSGRSLSGLEIHASAIDTILNKKYVSSPGWARGAELFAVIFLGIVSTVFLSRPGFMLSVMTVAVGSGGSYWAARQLLHYGGLFVSPLLSMLTPLVIMTVLSLLKYGIEAHKLRERNQNLIDAQDSIIVSMSALSEARDKETGGHILRTQHYVEILARQLATLPHYRSLDKTGIELLAKSAPLHDIGKVGIPDSILHKPGPLSEGEFAVMKTHTLIGARSLSRTIGGTDHPENLDFLSYARQMIESHHEHWDGSGYPHGLRGVDIPLPGRLMALADVYDALVSRRIYKQDFPHEEAKEIIISGSGKQFDPDVVAAFVAREMDFIRIAKEFDDSNERTRNIAATSE